MAPQDVFRRTVDAVPLPPENIAGLVLAMVLDRIRPWPIPGPRGLQRPLGGALMAAGALTAGWATAERPEPDLERPMRITTSGPYRFSRNPMYVGWHLIHLGAALCGGSTWRLLTLVAAVMRVHRGIRDEEVEMAARFHAEFARYADKVPRYVPPRFRGQLVRDLTAGSDKD